jgi:hypothetical protein
MEWVGNTEKLGSIEKTERPVVFLGEIRI